MGWPDLLMSDAIMMIATDDTIGDKTGVTDELSSLSPGANAIALNPIGYSRLHTLAHVAVDHEMVVCNLLIPNGTIDHTKLAAVYHQIQMNWCG
jgi:hypothetical protein